MTLEQASAVGAVAGVLALISLAVVGICEVRRRQQGIQARRTIPPPDPPTLTVALGPPRPIHLELGQTPILVRRGLPLVIQRAEAPLWQEKGWRRSGQGYEGAYQTCNRQWRGLILEPYPGSFDAYIWNPPLVELGRRTSHQPCFQGTGTNGRFRIHFHTMPSSLDHAIVSVEAVLAEAMNTR